VRAVRSPVGLLFASVSLAVIAFACEPDRPTQVPGGLVEVPPQPPPPPPPPEETAKPPEPPPSQPVARPNEPPAPPTDDADPMNGKFSLDDATAGLTGTGKLTATIKTSKGDLTCKLYDDKAPVTVANFVGLARGLRPFRTKKTGPWEKRPAYDGTTFHRIIKGFMVQGGDPLGNGRGEPGYVIKDEIWPGAKHDRPGLLCMANRGPNTNGVQFFITDAAAAHLDGNYTIFGECSPVSVVHAIAGVPVAGEHPVQDVTITTVEISRK